MNEEELKDVQMMLMLLSGFLQKGTDAYDMYEEWQEKYVK